MGDAFSVRLTGPGAQSAAVRFPSELGEDVRQPGETLTPSGAAGVYVVPGRGWCSARPPRSSSRSRRAARSCAASFRCDRSPAARWCSLNLAPQVGKQADRSRQGRRGRHGQQGVPQPGPAALDQAVRRRRAPTRRFPVRSVRAAPTPAAARSPTTTARTTRPNSARPIRAVNDGTVVIAGTYPVRGGLVMIDHGGGVSSLYFHQSRVLVKVGQAVKRGDVIGQVGTTGLSEGPHSASGDPGARRGHPARRLDQPPVAVKPARLQS